MRLDTKYSISEEVALEMSKKPKKQILEWLRSLPIHKGIFIDIRENKLKKLTNDIKQLSPKPSKSKPAGNTGADAKDNTERSGDTKGEN